MVGAVDVGAVHGRLRVRGGWINPDAADDPAALGDLLGAVGVDGVQVAACSAGVFAACGVDSVVPRPFVSW
jgi:hypothetical protein